MATRPSDPQGSTPATVRPWRVLVADDSVVVRRVLAALVGSIVTETVVVQAATGRETVEVLRAQSFDLCLIDAAMPDFGAFTVFERIRRARIDPLAVVLVDHMTPEVEAAAQRAGAYEILQKPVDETELRAIMSNIARMQRTARLLVVDDGEASRRLITKVLGLSRFKVSIDAVDGGEAALLALTHERYDAVLLDYEMPDIDGLETTCLIAEAKPGTRIVLMSANGNPALERAARYFGAVYYLRKPFFARDVDAALHVALDLPRSSLLMQALPDSAIEEPFEAAGP